MHRKQPAEPRHRPPQRTENVAAVITLAKQLHDYIRHRAKAEKVVFDLPVSMFAGALSMGCNPIFGVVHDGRRMLWDEQEPWPGYFEEKAIAGAD